MMTTTMMIFKAQTFTVGIEYLGFLCSKGLWNWNHMVF